MRGGCRFRCTFYAHAGAARASLRAMSYVISSDKPAFILRHARVASDALVIAEDLAAEGRNDVIVTTREGERLSLRQFTIALRESPNAL